MFAIGDFARLGRVSVRMLRHYDGLGLRLRRAEADVVPTGPAVASYAVAVDGLTIVDLPVIEAATVIHHGSMDDSDAAVQTLARWIDANGYTSTGYAREVNLECPPDRGQWVTELQESITAEHRRPSITHI